MALRTRGCSPSCGPKPARLPRPLDRGGGLRAPAARARPPRRRAAAARDAGHLVRLEHRLGATRRRRARGRGQARGDRLAAGAARPRHGIHPSVLTSHGLAAALESLGRDRPGAGRPRGRVRGAAPPAAEAAAYYLVCEALTNTAKHAHALSASVAVHREEAASWSQVDDDGVGGADTAGGSGPARLADRVEALDGRPPPYGEGDTAVHALRDVSLDIARASSPPSWARRAPASRP